MFTMLANRRFWHLGLISLVVSSIASAVNPSYAQIIPDATLGAESSVITPNVNIKGSPANQIDGGATRGANLFHSFSEFNVSNVGRVYFANPTGIENILTRVTGNNASSILGTLGVNGNANLFLINPNGIIFGENARLDIPGSFFVSTASALNFGNGNQFSAANPESPSLLAINVPMGVQYNNSQPAAIVNRGNLQVGQNLTLAANNVDLSGQLLAGGNLTLQATDTLQIRDTTTVPFIASAGGKMQVEGNVVDIFALNHPDSGFYSGSDMVFRSADKVGGDAHYSTGGNFRIEKLDGSLGNLVSLYDPIIFANGDFSAGSYTGTSLHILAGGYVYIPGTIRITGVDSVGNTINPTNSPTLANVTLSNGTSIVIDGSAQPTLDIRAGIDWTELLGTLPGNISIGIAVPAFAFGSTATSADIILGDITFDPIGGNGGKVFLTNQYVPNKSLNTSFGEITVGSIYTSDFFGGGSITINARNGIALAGPVNASSLDLSQFFAVPVNTYLSNGGDITLLANGNINPSSKIYSSGLLGGNISFITHGNISLTNPVISDSYTSVVGTGGNINFKGNLISLTNGALVIAIAFRRSNAGNINVQATDYVEVSGTSTDGLVLSGFLTQTQGDGNAGNLKITTNNLNIRDGAIVSSRTLSAGNAGILTIETGQLTIRDGGNVSAGTRGSGNGGTLLVKASKSVEVSGEAPNGDISALSVTTNGMGNAGNLTIETEHLSILDGAVVSASTRSSGNAGNLTVRASEVEVRGTTFDGLASASLNANVEPTGTGNGGNLMIDTERFTVLDGGNVSSANLGQGNGGSLIVNASDYVKVSGTSANGRILSGLFTQTQGAGDAGNLSISTGRLTVQDGGRVSASTYSQGQGGILSVIADSVELIGMSADGRNPSSLFATTGSTGNAGDLKINTRQLLVRDGAEASVATGGAGNGGSLTVNASDSVQLIGTSVDGRFRSLLSSSTISSGDAGDVNITTGRLIIQNGAVASVSTTGKGNGGTLNVNASDFVELMGSSTGIQPSSGLYARTLSSGKGGDLRISTGNLIILDGAQVAVSGTSSGDAGNIEITARSIFANNQGNIRADTESGEGGNIRLQVQDSIILRNNSNILTEARGTRNGGNININAGNFVIGVLGENSDVAANAFQGRGGKINATATGIFGFRLFKKVRTFESDFTASSAQNIDGIVNINAQTGVQPSILPSKFLPELVDGRCQVGYQRRSPSSFQITKTNNSPLSYNQADEINAPEVDIRIDNATGEKSDRPAENISDRSVQNSTNPNQLVEAQGFIVNHQGKIELTDVAPVTTLYSSLQSPQTCAAQQANIHH